MQALLSRAALQRAISSQRLAGYEQATDRDQVDALARYLWNMALASALLPIIHVFEVTLRNAIYDASLRIVDTLRVRMPDVPCWLDAVPSMLYANEKDAVDRAKTYLGRDPRGRTAGHLIGKLSFGFWVQLCSRVYGDIRANGPKLWPRALAIAFPYRFLPALNRAIESARSSILDSVRFAICATGLRITNPFGIGTSWPATNEFSMRWAG